MSSGLRLVFVTLFFAICLIFVLSVFVFRPETNDSLEYQKTAKNLVNKNLFYSGDTNETVDYRLFSKRTIGYPVFLVFQNNTTWIVRVASVFLLLLNFFVGLGLLGNLTRKKEASWVFSFLYLLNVPLLLHTSFVMADLLLTSIVCLAAFVYYHDRVLQKQKIKILSLFWCLGLLVKPIISPSILLSPFLFLHLKHKHKKTFLVTLLPVLVFFSFSFFNQKQTGIFEYSSISTINLGQYNSKLLVSEKFGYDSAQSYASRNEFSVPRNKKEYVKYGREVKSLSAKTILSNWPSYLKIHVLGSIKMLLDPGRFELYSFLGIKPAAFSLTEMIYAKDWQKLKRFMFSNFGVLFVFVVLFVLNVLKLFAFFLGVRGLKKRRFVAFVFLYFFVIVGPVGAARFMLPISVLYLVFCSIGWSRALYFFQKSSKG